MMPQLRWLFCSVLLWASAQSGQCRASGVPAGSRPVGPIPGGWVLPNGRLLRPWGDRIELPGQPFSLAITPDGKTGFLLVAANRFQDPWKTEATLLASIDLDRRTVTKTVRFDGKLSVGLGLAYAPTARRLFLSDPVGDRILVLRTPSLETEREIKLPQGSFPVGLAPLPDGSRVLAAANLSGNLLELDVSTGALLSTIRVGQSPGRVLLSSDGKRVFVSNWTSGTLSVVSLADHQVITHIVVGHHPESIVELPGGRSILVVVNGQDELAEVEVQSGQVRNRIPVAPFPGLLPGSSPSAAVLHPDGDHLFVCLAGDDALATVSLRERRLVGLTPVGWYPVDVVLAPDGRTAYVANMKSPSNLVPERHPELWHARYGKQGTVSVLATAPLPDVSATRSVLENLGLDKTKGSAPSLPRGLKRVVFILKENHTYDDYFGDLGRGEGDPALCVYGRRHTPNQHALADRFALCDNFYSEAEMSVEGHSWVEGANFSDVMERFWRLTRPHMDVLDPTYWPVRGSIFDACERQGVIYRIYGGALLSKHLEGKAQVRNFVEDPAAPGGYRAVFKTDVELAKRFADDLAHGLSAQFTYLTLSRDHPERGGREVNVPLVHDNDQATGLVVDAVSHNRHWAETAIFVVQDDPGNYIDHVATHRVPCLVISPFAKKAFIDHQHYSFPSILRTIEMILKLAPLSRYDSTTTPMVGCFEKIPRNRATFDRIEFHKAQ